MNDQIPVYATFTSTCRLCGSTVQTVAGHPLRHRCAPRWPQCHEAVVDADGEEVPCEKPAVRNRVDDRPDEEPSVYPVCAEHDRPPYPQEGDR